MIFLRKKDRASHTDVGQQYIAPKGFNRLIFDEFQEAQEPQKNRLKPS